MKATQLLYQSALLTFAVIVTDSCTKDNLVQNPDNAVSISVSDITGMSTTEDNTAKSRIILEPQEIGYDLWLSAYEEDVAASMTYDTMGVKGKITTNESFPTDYSGGFTVYAYQHGTTTALINGQTFKLTGSRWTNTSAPVWPAYRSDFYVWAQGGGTASWAAANRQLTYTVNATNTSQKDLLVAKQEDVSGWYNQTLPLTFDHALCAVKFVTNVKMPAGKITQIKISNILNKGTYSFANGEWSGQTSKSSVTAGSLAVQTQDVTPDVAMTSEEQYFFLIPQTCGTDCELQITFALNGRAGYTDGSLTATTVKIPLKDIVLKAGKVITFRIGAETDYSFQFEDPSKQELSFENASADSGPVNVNVTSTESVSQITTTVLKSWKFKSYTIDGVTSDVSGDFSAGGLTFTKATGTDKAHQYFTVTASKREGTGSSIGGHSYWVNQSGRSDNLDWSPSDWTTETASSPVDLSRYDMSKEQPFDSYTSAQSNGVFNNEMNTANCYLIRHAGTYKLPIVYGNAVIGSSENRKSFAPGEGVTNFKGLSPFQNHLSKGITSAFIEENESATSGVNIKINSCEILWQDEDMVLGNPTITGPETVMIDGVEHQIHYLQFTVSNATVCQNNAVIAVKDDNDNIAWSWHIWTTNDPAVMSSSVEVTNYTGYHYKFFPISCLGLIEPFEYDARPDVLLTLEQDGSGKTIDVLIKQPISHDDGNGIHYQFGRKDPMSRIDNPKVGQFLIGKGKVEIATSIKNPNVFYTWGGSGKYNWVTPNDYTNHCTNLWSGRNTTISYESIEQDDDMFKTIYDPSPVGYKVPSSSAFTGFTTTGAKVMGDPSKYNVHGKYDHGWYFYREPHKTVVPETGETIFFVTAGFRDHNGKLFDIYDNMGGRYWAAMASVGEHDNYSGAFCMSFGSDYVIPFSYYDYRCSGYSVRPVKE